MAEAEDSYIDYYALLSVSPSATSGEIKAAYHRSLLSSHPDKLSGNAHHIDIDIGLLKDAFRMLYNSDLRKAYDEFRAHHTKVLGPRPAQVISLEEFDQVSDTKWTHPCRCGGTYIVTEVMLDAGQHLFGCISCSEVVWVGYEIVGGEEDLVAR